MLMGRRFAGVLIIMLFVICTLPTVTHGYSNVRTNVNTGLGFCPQSEAVQIPGLVGNAWPNCVLAGSLGDVIFALSASSFTSRPGWTIVSVTADGNTRHQFINFTNGNEYYYIRINGVLAPLIAGTYFFKMY